MNYFKRIMYLFGPCVTLCLIMGIVGQTSFYAGQASSEWKHPSLERINEWNEQHKTTVPADQEEPKGEVLVA